jgi:hypothetical protein
MSERDELKVVWIFLLSAGGFALFEMNGLALILGVFSLVSTVLFMKQRGKEMEPVRVLSTVCVQLVILALTGLAMKQPVSILLALASAFSMNLMEEEDSRTVLMAGTLLVLVILMRDADCFGFGSIVSSPWIMKKILAIYEKETCMKQMR